VIDRPLAALAGGAKHTVFHAEGNPAAARKQWLAGALEVRGKLTIDSGAVQALGNGNSLLPVGVTSVSGKFQRGDVVAILTQDGRELGRGLAEYSSDDAAALVGVRSPQIEQQLGYRGRSVIVHRDELVLF
jgi:glutamate 5-kinase